MPAVEDSAGFCRNLLILSTQLPLPHPSLPIEMGCCLAHFIFTRISLDSRTVCWRECLRVCIYGSSNFYLCLKTPGMNVCISFVNKIPCIEELCEEERKRNKLTTNWHCEASMHKNRCFDNVCTYYTISIIFILFVHLFKLD